MADSDPLSQMFNLVAAPLAGTIQSFEQFRRGVEEFLRGVENFNRTMENLNETTERINRLVADVEEPIRAAIPQMTRSIKAADDMMQVVSGPAMAAAPGLERLAQTLSTPAFTQLPNQLGQFTDILGDLQNRLGPLTQLAESAGGLFGGFRLPGMGAPKPAEKRAPTPEPEPAAARPVKKTAAKKKSAAKKSTAKKSSATRQSS
jgi:ABC-type transporter Mla subunit MlaD